MRSKIKKQNKTSGVADSSVMLPGEFLDKLRVVHPEEYNALQGMADNAIISMTQEAEKTEPFSFAEFCYWLFILRFLNSYLEQFQYCGMTIGRTQLHMSDKMLKKFNGFDDL